MDISKFNFVKINQFKKSPFCVDGRAGKVNGEIYGPYPQMLGGSLMPVVLDWLINHPSDNLESVLVNVFVKLKEFGYQLGVHTSTHAYEGKSDCGFADNLRNILSTLKKRLVEIKEIISSVGVDFNDQTWKKIKENLEKVNLEKLPKGKDLINKAEESGALKQVLDGEHAEVAAIINLKEDTTLDVDNNQSHQAFNFDLWLVREIAEKMLWDRNLADALSLGLYVATEMVLVEGKGKPRLPILINK